MARVCLSPSSSLSRPGHVRRSYEARTMFGQEGGYGGRCAQVNQDLSQIWVECSHPCHEHPLFFD